MVMVQATLDYVHENILDSMYLCGSWLRELPTKLRLHNDSVYDPELRCWKISKEQIELVDRRRLYPDDNDLNVEKSWKLVKWSVINIK